LNAAPIPAIHLSSFSIQPHINRKTLAAFEHGYPVFALLSQLKLPYLFTPLNVLLHA
jgi:hypothetical protein